MLKADISLPDLALDVAWANDSLVMGQSRITPFAHRMLETWLVRTDGQWFVTVRERLASRANEPSMVTRTVHADEFNRLYHESLLWPLDYLMIEVAQAGCRMKVRAGVLGTVPVYFRHLHDRVLLSWDPAELLVGPLAIDIEMASHRLALHSVYAARQVSVGVSLLTERATLYAEPGRFDYRYPTAAEDTLPVPLPEGSDATSVFAAALQRTVALRPVAREPMTAELSGGMDSATVACALAASVDSLETLGILLDGATRQSQVQRRRQITQQLDLSDHTVEMSQYPPVVDVEPRPGQRPVLYWDYYLDASMGLWTSARQRGRDTLFTGIGGDELFPYYLDEAPAAHVQAWQDGVKASIQALLTPRAWSAANSQRLFDAPVSPVPASVLLAHASRTPDMLRQGLWPVNPLSDPRLVAFCHRLPADSRRGRQVMRAYLRKQLDDDVFTHDYVKESFAHVLPQQIAKQSQVLASQLRECALADLGLVRLKAVHDLLQQVVVSAAPMPTAVLAAFLWLERLARQLS